MEFEISTDTNLNTCITLTSTAPRIVDSWKDLAPGEYGIYFYWLIAAVFADFWYYWFHR
jgi:sterol desaturase/sphingolipid hydroxylase (fatty acid hydroxylase superfamily)